MLGIGVNVALDPATLPPEVAAIAGTLGRDVEQVEPTLVELLSALEQRLTEDRDATLAALRDRDALLGQPVRWQDGEGTGAGIDASGALLVNLADGSTTALSRGRGHAQHVSDRRVAQPEVVELDAASHRCGRARCKGMDLELNGRVAVVTGASKGIGLAIARTLLEEGAHVVAASRTRTGPRRRCTSRST